MAMADLTADELRKVLHYDKRTGRWTWLVNSRGRFAKAGSPAGWVNDQGYRRIAIRGKTYTSSRLAYLYVLGEWPTHEIDHRNRDRSDDRWFNLRPATRSQNGANKGPQKNNSVGCKGVSKTRGGKFAVFLRRKYIGTFSTKEEAQAAYQKTAKAVFGVFANG
jgi:hypothetical protein